jgi:hypothetical protein
MPDGKRKINAKDSALDELKPVKGVSSGFAENASRQHLKARQIAAEPTGIMGSDIDTSIGANETKDDEGVMSAFDAMPHYRPRGTPEADEHLRDLTSMLPHFGEKGLMGQHPYDEGLIDVLKEKRKAHAE